MTVISLKGELGGGASSYPIWKIIPSSFAFGSVVVNQSTFISVKVTNTGKTNLSLDSVSITGAGAAAFSTSLVAPKTITPGSSITFTITFAPTVAQAYSATIKFLTNDINSPHSYPLSGTGLTSNNNVQTDQPSYTFPDTKAGATSVTQNITLKNTGQNADSITVISVGTTNFTLSGLPALPLNLGAGASVTFQCAFTPGANATGFLSDTLTVTGSVASTTAALQGDSLPLIAVSILAGLFTLMFGFNDPVQGGFPYEYLMVTPTLNQSSFNIDQDTILVFNGALWKRPAKEKTILRVWIAYENFGPCQLTGTLKVWRPELNNNAGGFNTVSKTISIGDNTIDFREMSTYIDLEMSGEIVEFSLTRTKSSGSLSLISAIPQFVEAGEKVENV